MSTTNNCHSDNLFLSTNPYQAIAQDPLRILSASRASLTYVYGYNVKHSKNTGVVSGIGAVVALITILFFALVAFMAYRVYKLGYKTIEQDSSLKQSVK